MSEVSQGDQGREQGGGGQGGGQQQATWRDSLPEDIRGDATLSRYNGIEDLARGHIEAHKVAKSKITLPGEGADETAWGEFFDKIGRPKSPDDYEIPMPELAFGDDATDDVKAAAIEAQKEAFKPYRELAHKIGLLPQQAAALAQFDLDREAAFYAKGEEEIAALKKEMGAAYEPARAQAEAIFQRLGFGEDFVGMLERKVGSASLVKGFMRLAGIAGEPIVTFDETKGDGDLAGNGDPEATLRAKQADAEWRKKFEAGDATVRAEYDRLLDAAKRQALKSKS